MTRKYELGWKNGKFDVGLAVTIFIFVTMAFGPVIGLISCLVAGFISGLAGYPTVR